MTTPLTKLPTQWLDLLKSAVRTAVPLLVTAAVAYAHNHGVDIPEWGGVYAVPVLCGFAYWLIARIGEIKLSPKFGVLLLAIGKPVYETAAQALDKTTVPVLTEVPVATYSDVTNTPLPPEL